MKNVLLIAAENDALSHAKVGGVADVVRDLPPALAAQGWGVTVIIPSYGLLHEVEGATHVRSISVRYRGTSEDVDVWEVPGKFGTVTNLVVDHPVFAATGIGEIYHSDDTTRPFATDANKFSLLSAAAATWVETSEARPDVVHLHDWHAAFYCLLREYSDRLPSIRAIRTVFTIHNLSYQGIRPFADDESSLQSWFPDLQYDEETIADPVYRDCVNPMLAGIRLSDSVSTVSPTYAKEICRPSDPETGFVGGEGLEEVISETAADGRLVGMVNGCYYDVAASAAGWPQTLDAMRAQVSAWQKQSPGVRAHQVAARTLGALSPERPSTILLSIGRLVAQKATLFVTEPENGKAALQQIVEQLDDDALLIILGSGERRFEAALVAMASMSEKILFLQGYSESLSEPLYGLADLFLMPSSFEPCGISQMLAMRESLPCVVHDVGGLKDTVVDGVTGFCFGGNTLEEQAAAFVNTTMAAVEMLRLKPGQFRKIRNAAGEQRFEWSDTARQTIEKLYRPANA